MERWTRDFDSRPSVSMIPSYASDPAARRPSRSHHRGPDGGLDRSRLLSAGWMAEKIAGLRLFSDSEGKMNLGLEDVGGAVLVVSQFTLYGDAVKGRRPSFIQAARPELAVPLYEQFLDALRSRGLTVAAGEFGADMQVEIHNDGPVTLILDRVP